ncbi:MAG TPA: F0F1 ATP synthase subunit A [Alphaproteobacteria bacterium]|nr:F0F1 ATP synthase subunit A [Alphaproteobacteria bacterium]
MAETHNPLAQFEIKKLLDIDVAGYDISYTNSSMMLTFIVIAIVGLLFAGTRNISLIPSKIQAFVELIYEFIANMLSQNVGKEGLKYFPLICSIFLLILGCNLAGMIPYAFTVTSHIAVTFAFAFFMFIVVNIIGFARHGLHYLALFAPSGIPKAMLPIVSVIEIVSFLIRPFSLAIRLAAAMSAGHLVTKIFALFVISLGSISIFFGIFPVLFISALTALEILVCFIQAFIFSILICIYLNDAVNMH